MKKKLKIHFAILAFVMTSCGQADLSERPDFDQLNLEKFHISYAEEYGIVESMTALQLESDKHQYNGSIFKNKNSEYVLFFRELVSVGNNRIGYRFLDKRFKPEKGPFYFELEKTMEDPRVVVSQTGRIILVANRHCNKKNKRQIVFLELDQLDQNEEKYFSILSRRAVFSENNEKNWSPFFQENKLFFSYNLNNSHDVLSEDGICSARKCEFDGQFFSRTESTKWNWGELRGGTPAHLVETKRYGPAYLSFFHSVYKRGGLVIYFAGAYLFETAPPFKMVAMSKIPFITREMYSCERKSPIMNSWLVVYPTGLLIENNNAIMSFGVNDACIKVVRINLDNLFESMEPV